MFSAFENIFDKAENADPDESYELDPLFSYYKDIIKRLFSLFFFFFSILNLQQQK